MFSFIQDDLSHLQFLWCTEMPINLEVTIRMSSVLVLKLALPSSFKYCN